MEYVIRENSKLNDEMENKSVSELLEKDYNYIYESMIVENYTLNFDECSIFKEIVFESKVVGFITFSEDYSVNFSLLDVFILPEFRGNHLFFMDFSFFLASGKNVSIAQPTRSLVEILMHYGLAAKLTDSLVATAIPFDMISDNIIGDNDFGDNEYISNLYDLNLCSTILLEDISTPGVCEIYYHEVLSDDERYNASEFRNSIDIDDYFNDIKKSFLKNHLEFQEILFELRNNLPEPIFDFEEIIGHDDGLSEYMLEMIDDGIITAKKAIEIKKRLQKEYGDGDVRDDGIHTRLIYLASGMDLSEDRELFFTNLENAPLCPDCYQPINLSDSYCRICGFNISGGKTLNYDEVTRDLSDNNDNIIDLRGNSNIIDRLYEIYSDDSFENDEYGLSIDDMAEYHSKSQIDLSHYFMDEVYYTKNYSRPNSIENQGKLDKYKLNDAESPYYSYDMYKVLNALNYNPKIDEVCENLDLSDANKIKALCFQLNLIESKNYGEDIYRVMLDSNRVCDFKEILRENNLKVSGNKVDLATRIVENGLYTQIGDDEYVLNENGEEALSKLNWISFYELGMEMFDFDDLEMYLKENKLTHFPEGAIKYLNEHSNRAYKNKDYYLLYDVLASKAMLYVYYDDMRKALMEELKLFQLKLNPIFLDDEELESYEAIEVDNVNNIVILLEILGISNVKKIFNKTWSYMKFEKRLINKKNSLKYLNRLINGENIIEVSDEISQNYFR
ncbi:hypothetical protein [Methanobrevibacter sp.]|uniref:hypothetical protein n=1 Tax=Methanobrevibacter sp. TaxID=66852 RepID=UPI0038902496